MSKIVKFPERGQRDEEFELDYEQMYRAEVALREARDRQERSHEPVGQGGGWTILNITKLVWAVVRIPIFLMLFFLRGPVVVLCSILYFPMFLLALFTWYAWPEKPQMWASFGVISFVSCMLMYVYDLVLSWLSPTDLERS